MHPILFQLGPLTLYSYGLMIALGFLAAVTVAGRRARQRGLPAEKIQTLNFVALLSGIVGGRLAYVALNWDFYRKDLLEVLRLDHGGLVFYGGLALGLLAGFLSMRRSGLPVLRTLDLMVPPLVLAHAVGRVGCFLNGCCYGTFTDLPWGVAFPPETLHRHPTQLYEAAALALFFLWLSRLQGRPGTVLLSYGLLYGLWRFGIEFIRGDNPSVLGGLTVFQWVSIPLAVLCGALLLRRWLPRKSS